jgi:peptide/nickel transport system substrate-binding protein
MKISSRFLVASASCLLIAAASPAMAERVLRLNESPVGEIDPAKGLDYADTVLAINLYDTLVYPAQGKPGIQPLLATEWTIDGSVYTFKLRDDVKFSSGNPLTAEDVAFSFNRFVALGQGYSNLFAGRVASVEAVDPTTVRFTLSEPYAPFLTALTRLPIVDSKIVLANLGAGDFGDLGDYGSAYLSAHSAGSGAYVVESQEPQSETIMVRNAGYFLPFAENAPDRVRYRYGIEASTLRALMSRGEHDISDLWLPPEVIAALANEGVAHLVTEKGGMGEYIKLNTTRAPLDDVHCRRALGYAYDYANSAMLQRVNAEFSQAMPMTGVLPSGLLGYDADGAPFAQDMDKAREELALCKYDPADYPLDVAWIAEVPARERIALLMQATFSQLGFKVNLVRTPWALVVEQVANRETAPHAVEIEVHPPTPDSDSLLYNMYSPDVPATYLSTSAKLDDPKVAELLNAGRAETDEAKREAIYSELNAYLTTLQPDIMAYEFIGVFAVRNGVEMPNFSDDAHRYSLTNFNMLFRDISIND